MRRTSEGLVIVPSGPAPTIAVSLAGVASEAADFVRLRVRTPQAVSGAYIGWSSVDSSGRAIHSGVTFDVPRQLRGGFSRTVWVRVGGAPDWSGDVRWLGLVIPAEGLQENASIVIESIGLFQATFLTTLRMAWASLAFDEAAEDMAVPIWSLNDIRSPRFDYGTPYGMASVIALLGMLGVGVSRRIRRPQQARAVRGVALVTVGLAVVILSALAVYLEVFALKIERVMFGGTTVSQDYASLDGLDLVGVAEDLHRVFPDGASIAVCYFGGDGLRHILSNRVRYQFYPIKILDHAGLVLAFSGHEETCGVSPGDRLIDRPLYTLYRSP